MTAKAYKNELLNERNKTHGDFAANARVSQELKRILLTDTAWQDFPYDMRESLHMIALKLSRIVTGNPNEPDHWEDIAGYANLISERLRRGE